MKKEIRKEKDVISLGIKWFFRTCIIITLVWCIHVLGI